MAINREPVIVEDERNKRLTKRSSRSESMDPDAPVEMGGLVDDFRNQRHAVRRLSNGKTAPGSEAWHQYIEETWKARGYGKPRTKYSKTV